jgi:hypothetical protein
MLKLKTDNPAAVLSKCGDGFWVLGLRI